MREVDTEAPVVWPAWCYSANTQESAIDVISRKGDTASELLPQTATSPSSYIQTSSTTILPAQATIQTGVSTSNKIRARRKNTYTTSLTKATSQHQSNSGTFSPAVASLEAVQAAAAAAAVVSHTEKLQQQLQLSSYLIKKSTTVSSVEKMLSERMLIGFGNAIDNNTSNTNNNNKNKNCDNSTSILHYDKIKNESQMMDTSAASSASILKNGDLSTNNNNNNNNSSVTNNSSTSSSNNIKRERLSPLANGDVQSSLSRSRSATPSSFPGTPPHPSDLVSQNLLSSIQSRNNEFQTRNYSDFMRSLAAKYNNSSPNDASTARSIFFDHQKYASGSSKTCLKESPSSPESKRQSLPTPPQMANVPFASSLFSGLPFSSAVFPTLIDMSSTQALVTLARAAKEAEIQNILRNAQQKRPSTGQSLSPSMRSTLTPTPQSQHAQFASQPFILPSQYHPPHQNPGSSHNSRSPHLHRNDPSPSTSLSAALNNNPSSISAAPLDLSSTPQPKRFKRDSNASPAITPPPPPIALLQHSSIKIETGSNMSYSSPTASTAAVVESAGNSRVEFPRHCRAQSDEINSWNVDEVCHFVSSIDICAEYVQNFRDQCIDGSGLPLLTEDHLTNSLGMKLGPALKLRSILAKKLGGPCPCVSCTTLIQQQQQQQQQQQSTHLNPSTASSSISSTSSLSGSANLNSNNNTSAAGQSSSTTTSSSIKNPRPASADSGS